MADRPESDSDQRLVEVLRRSGAHPGARAALAAAGVTVAWELEAESGPAIAVADGGGQPAVLGKADDCDVRVRLEACRLHDLLAASPAGDLIVALAGGRLELTGPASRVVAVVPWLVAVSDAYRSELEDAPLPSCHETLRDLRPNPVIDAHPVARRPLMRNLADQMFVAAAILVSLPKPARPARIEPLAELATERGSVAHHAITRLILMLGDLAALDAR